MTAAFIDAHAGQSSHAQEFYDTVGYETDHTGAAFQIAEIHMVQPRMTLETLLDAILAATPHQRILTVHHGTPEGLSIPLFTGDANRNRQASARNLGLLAGTHNILGSGSSATVAPIGAFGGDGASDARLGRFWGKPEGRIAALRDKMRQVQALSTQALEIRACNIGSGGQGVLTEIAGFFGVGEICAPRITDVFGRLPIRTEADSDGAHRTMRRLPAGEWVPYPENRVTRVWVNCANMRGVAVDSAPYPHLRAFLAGHLAAGGHFSPTPAQVGQARTLHGQNRGIVVHGFEGALQIAGSRYEAALILPGMAAYAGNLAHVHV